jgi:hypothetical protein
MGSILGYFIDLTVRGESQLTAIYIQKLRSNGSSDVTSCRLVNKFNRIHGKVPEFKDALRLGRIGFTLSDAMEIQKVFFDTQRFPDDVSDICNATDTDVDAFSKDCNAFTKPGWTCHVRLLNTAIPEAKAFNTEFGSGCRAVIQYGPYFIHWGLDNLAIPIPMAKYVNVFAKCSIARISLCDDKGLNPAKMSQTLSLFNTTHKFPSVQFNALVAALATTPWFKTPTSVQYVLYNKYCEYVFDTTRGDKEILPNQTFSAWLKAHNTGIDCGTFYNVLARSYITYVIYVDRNMTDTVYNSNPKIWVCLSQHKQGST